MTNETLVVSAQLLGAGSAGAFLKEILSEGFLKMPSLKEGKFYMGFVGSMIVGAAVGFLVDHSPLMAFFAGYSGFAAAAALIQTKMDNTTKTTVVSAPLDPAKPDSAAVMPQTTTPTIEQIIANAAKKFGVDPALALAVAKCESALNPKARNVNTTGSIDRGLYQINNHYHPDVSDEQADDPVFAAEWFCQAVKNGNLSWWNASKPCWGSALK